MYTKIAKFLLNLCSVVVVIASLVVLFIEPLIALIVLGVGLLSLCVLGVAIEQADNVMEIRRMLERGGSLQTASNSTIEYSDIKTKSSESGHTSLEMANAQSGKWICPYCGECNVAGAIFCKDCGKAREGIKDNE